MLPLFEYVLPPLQVPAMNKLLQNFYKFLLFLSGVGMLSTFLIIMLGVAARQFAWNIPGLDAYAGYAIAATLFLALPATLRHGDHIRVTMVLSKLPPRILNIFEYWCLTAASVLSIYFAYYAGRLMWQSHVYHDVSSGADATPLWIPQVLMLLGCIGLAVAFVDALISRIQGRHFFEVADGESARAE
jgi:TRAP-type C4-dicarboxylate transport system permease small subunit